MLTVIVSPIYIFATLNTLFEGKGLSVGKMTGQYSLAWLVMYQLGRMTFQNQQVLIPRGCQEQGGTDSGEMVSGLQLI